MKATLTIPRHNEHVFHAYVQQVASQILPHGVSGIRVGRLSSSTIRHAADLAAYLADSLLGCYSHCADDFSQVSVLGSGKVEVLYNVA